MPAPVRLMDGMTPQRATEIEACMDLRATGMSLTDITHTLATDKNIQLSRVTVQRRLQEGYNRIILPAVEHARAAAVDKHERMLTGIATKVAAGDLNACTVWLRAMDQIAKLQGLYAPVAVTVEHTTPDSVDDELNRLANLLGLNTPNPAPTPAP